VGIISAFGGMLSILQTVSNALVGYYG